MLKKCKKHGETEHVKEVRNYLRCKKCRYEAVKRRRIKIKDDAIEYKGGSCEHCGYNKCARALEFHHADPDTKDFQVGGKANIAWHRIKEELDKCIMLCANCHREEHYKLNNN